MAYLHDIQQAARQLLEDQFILSDQLGYTCNEIAFLVRQKYDDTLAVHVAVKKSLSEIAHDFVLTVYEKAVHGEIELSERAIKLLKDSIEINYYRGAFIHDISAIGEDETDSVLFAEYRRQWLEFIINNIEVRK
ncbi:hypothetical protein OLCHANIL_00149 [Vibrio phage V05]|nr:hypothetical protein OLCHANIL_00149 [Vibrio phage V05]